MVSISIVLIISGVVLVRYSNFNSAVLLRNLAFDIAISLREAQVLSVSVLGGGSDFSSGYGIYVDWNGSGSNSNEYILFHDIDGDYVYDGSSEDFEVFTIDSQYQITDVCRTTTGGRSCGISPMTIVFERPEFDALFNQFNNPGIDAISLVEIEVDAVDSIGAPRTIEIGATGQISVK